MTGAAVPAISVHFTHQLEHIDVCMLFESTKVSMSDQIADQLFIYEKRPRHFRCCTHRCADERCDVRFGSVLSNRFFCAACERVNVRARGLIIVYECVSDDSVDRYTTYMQRCVRRVSVKTIRT